MFPSPPPQRETVGTPRIALAASFPPDPENEAEPERQFRAMHPMGAELTQECVTMMGESMCTPLFHNQPPRPLGAHDGRPHVGPRPHAAHLPGRKNGLHLYTPEEGGIDPAQVRRDFAPHIEHHAVAPE